MDDKTIYSIKTKYQVEPSETAGHSYIKKTTLGPFNPGVEKLGPVPNVLVNEVMRELKVAMKSVLNSFQK